MSAGLFLGGVLTGMGLLLVFQGLVDWLARRAVRP
jgi:hypothetical protein